MPSALTTFFRQSTKPLNYLFFPDITSAESRVLTKSNGKIAEIAQDPARPPERIEAIRNLYLF